MRKSGGASGAEMVLVAWTTGVPAASWTVAELTRLGAHVTSR
jgi:hypothetical protein